MRSLFLSLGTKINRPYFKTLSYPHYHLTLSELKYVHGLDEKSLLNYRIIQITRNPFSRFVSAWKHQERILKSPIDVNEFIDRLFLYKSLLPKEWEEFYVKFYNDPDHKNKSLEKGNWGGLRFYCDQVDWNDLYQKVNYFKLEDLSNDTSSLSDFLGVKLPQLEKRNSGSYDKTAANSLTYSQKSSIYKLFGEDFKILNYGF